MPTYGVDTYGTEPYGGETSLVTPAPSPFPALLLEEAFLTVPLAETPLFVDLGADDVWSFDTTQNARSSDLDKPSAGSGTFVVDTSQRRDLDPTNPDSVYAPYLTPNRRVRLRMIADGVTYPIWEGFADAHNMRFSMGSGAFCDLLATDAFKLLSQSPLTGMPTRPKERADIRVAAILDWIGWPTTRRQISMARTILIAEDISDRNALDALLQIDDTEIGRVTVDPGGEFVFMSRGDMQSASRQTTSQATFSDSGAAGTIPYSSIMLDSSAAMVRNIIEITHPTADPIVVTDEPSRALNGPLPFSREVRDVTKSARRATAEYFLATYKDLFTRVLGLSVLTSDFPPGYETGLYAQMASLKVGDRVTVEQHHPAGGDAFVQECFIESKTDAASREDSLWTTGLGLSFAPPAVTYAKWGSGEWDQDPWGF